MSDSIQQRVLAAFQQEHREQITTIRSILASDSLQPEMLDEVSRLAHSMKGGARVCSLPTVEKLAHQLEHLFAAIKTAGGVISPEHRAASERLLNAVEDHMAAIAEGRVPEEPVELLAGEVERPQAGSTPRSAGQAQISDQEAPEPQPAVAEVSPAQAADKSDTPRTAIPRADTLRVGVAELNRLLQSSALVLSETMRQESITEEMRKMDGSLRAALRDLENRVSKSAGGSDAFEDLRREIVGLSREMRRVRALHSQGTRILRLAAEQMRAEVRSANMVPAGSIFDGFSRMVRDLARDMGKEVDLHISGMEREADRAVIQALKDPVMHALRNAVGHGIESPGERSAAGKPAKGRVQLEVEVSGSELLVRVIDDGRGLDIAAIRRRAIESNLVSGEAASRLSTEETLDLVFHPGFSTTTTLTNISGRGLGLSIVKEAALRLQGSAHIKPAKPVGTIIEIRAPLSAALHKLLLVRSAGQIMALPAHAVYRLYRLPAEEIRTVEGASAIWVEGQAVTLTSLASLLGQGSAPLVAAGGFLRIALVRTNSRLIAVGVDAFVRELNGLLKPLPYPASLSPFFSGAVLDENGTVFPVLNVGILVTRGRRGTVETRVEPSAMEQQPRRPTILVVDDSFTARTLQKSILEAEGYDVRIAVDGAQGFAMLRAGRFDVVVSDVQMPRMDGFELLEQIKRDPNLHDTPVVLVTSLNSEEDQARGLSLGAHAYIVKQKFDHRDLIDAVRQLV